jgi:PPOX class probable F420-dependent enzyme
VKVVTAERVEAMGKVAQDDSRYVALTTYRGDGRAVTTPVWGVSLDGRIYVFTASSTGKAKRVRATGRGRFAPCSMNGRGILGAWQEGTGRVVHDKAPQDRALAALQRKYDWQLSVAMLVSRLRRLCRDRWWWS